MSVMEREKKTSGPRNQNRFYQFRVLERLPNSSCSLKFVSDLAVPTVNGVYCLHTEWPVPIPGLANAVKKKTWEYTKRENMVEKKHKKTVLVKYK